MPALAPGRARRRPLRGRFTAAGARSSRAASRGRPRRRCAGRWRCGAARPWRTLASERFAQPEIARLEDLRLACLAERVDADLACGHHAEVAGELEARVREHPLHERLRGPADARPVPRRAPGRRAGRPTAAAYWRSSTASGSSPRQRCATSRRRSCARTSRRRRRRRRGRPRRADARRRVTCVFSRLASRRAAGPRARDPACVLERYQTACRAVCARHGGAVAELRSDACSPRSASGGHEDDAQRAVRAAELGCASAELPRVCARCGVSTGEVAPRAETVRRR